MTSLLQTWLLEHLLMGRVTQIDALELLSLLPDASVDAIVTDLPYGTTACAWDQVIPFAPMWTGVRRVLKPRGVFVTTASQPFTSALVMSNPTWFRYEWIWQKTVGSNPMLTTWQPFKKHENVLIFSETQPVYYPQMEEGTPYKDRARKSGLKALHATAGMKKAIDNDGTRVPSSVQLFPNPNNDTVHPTQKPVALYRYLVRTYTQPGDLVLDFCCGSGTTGIACREEGRRFILGERDAEIAATAQARLDAPYTPNMFAGTDAA